MTAVSFYFLLSIIPFCISLQLSLSTADTLGNATDRLALVAFKEKITSDPLQTMSSWNETLHFCQWEGITCSGRHQRVIMLNLQNQGLRGSISPFIGNLSFLRSINVRNNSLSGQLPQEIGRLFRLQYLRGGNNSFSGQIPTNLSRCSNLIFISLGYNNFEGKIPVEFGSLLKLSNLSFSTNNLTGEIPAFLGNLSFLENLYLNANNFEGSIPNSFGQLRRLIRFYLGENRLHGTIPPSLYNVSSLEEIYLADNELEGNLQRDIGHQLPNIRLFLVSHNNFSGSIPVSLFSNVSGLARFDVGFNNFIGKVPTEVGNVKGLEILQLAINNLGSGKDDLNFITALTNCSELQFLDIGVNYFRDTLPTSILNLSGNLNALYFGDNQISGTIPSHIGNFINLRLLSAENNLLTGGIPRDIGTLENLQGLLLNRNRFSGQIPYSLGNISRLVKLDLSDNILEGNIHPTFENCKFLDTLNLSHNHLNGTIPKEVVGLSRQLRLISLAHNHLIGLLPSEVEGLKNLQMLDVSRNKLVGRIPSALSSCSSLEYLYLQDNSFQGSIPSSFSSLKAIQELDLSRNNLSGVIPQALKDLSFKSLNLSFNNFEGEVPVEGIFQNASAFTVVGNNKLCGGIPELHLYKCRTRRSKSQGIPLSLKLMLSILVPSLVIGFILAFYWRKKTTKRELSPEPSPRNGLTRVSYNELHKATDGFSSANLIGMGSYGSVYQGVLSIDEGPIAVKVLNLVERGGLKSFIAECEVLREVRHRNLVKILTVCSSMDSEGNDFKALVFAFMPNGSVEDWLHPSSHVQFSKRIDLLQKLNIAIDVASALDYLHNYSEIPIVHCDLKPSNVLLDNDMVAYVGDFGLAKFLPKINNGSRSETISVAVRGTIGYIPPEYGIGVEVSKQGDVYSYGILLLEMFTGKRPTHEMFKDGQSLHSYSKMNITEQVMDIADMHLLSEKTDSETTRDKEEQRLVTEQKKECLISIMRIGVECSEESVVKRKDIKDVLNELHAIKRNFVK